MAAETLRFSPKFATLARAKELAAEKYGTNAWLEKVS
jgi:hypothetical protein